MQCFMLQHLFSAFGCAGTLTCVLLPSPSLYVASDCRALRCHLKSKKSKVSMMRDMIGHTWLIGTKLRDLKDLDLRVDLSVVSKCAF